MPRLVLKAGKQLLAGIHQARQWRVGDAGDVYQEMMFGVKATDPVARETYRQLLLQYCGLDTGAMVMIRKHWTI